MSIRKGIEVSLAVAEAVGRANVDVVAAYPITPQTHIVEHLAELIVGGELNAEFVPVESEHSAISACIGSAMAGGRTFTASASQGLALMHEILFMASSFRAPIVMSVANRALSTPINIWADHSDVMPERDTGWVQLFAENGQEAYDLTIQAFKVAEDHRVLLPVMVNLDGFTLSHVIESVILLNKEEVDAFLPPLNPARMLDLKNPRSIGAFGAQDVYTEVKKQQEEALLASYDVLNEVWSEYESAFGRGYEAVEGYALDGAEVILVTMGSVGETARMAVDEMRAEGIKVGLARIRLWRPFPFEEFFEKAAGARTIAVLDRMLSPGSQGGPLGIELRSAFYDQANRPAIYDFVAGLGGREISRTTFRRITELSMNPDSDARYTFLDVRLK